MHVIAIEDYPERWPNVLMQIGENLTSDNTQVCYASLCALKSIIRKYQSKIGKERKPLLEITENAFGILETLFEAHLKSFDEPSVLIMTVLTKIFYFVNYVVAYPVLLFIQIEVDLEQIKTGKIETWLNYFKIIMERDYEDLEEPSIDPGIIDKKEKDSVTALLGAAAQASYRLLQKFGNKKVYAKKPEFAQYYVQNLAQPSMEAHLYIISKKDKFVGRKARYFSLRYIELLIQNPDTCALVEPHMKALLHEYLIPLLSMNVQDAIEFEQNPDESIRKELTDDPSHSDNCPKVAAKGLLIELCSYRPNKDYKVPALLDDFLHLCVDHLNECKNDSSVDFRVKDATLFSLYSICPIIEKHDHLLQGLESLLTEHVLYELNSEDAFMKARALLCYNEVTTRLDLEDPVATEEYCQLLFNNTDKSQCLNVKVYSLSCIKKICSSDIGTRFFRDKVGNLLETCLEVLDQFFIEDLIEILNEIVHVFYEEIIPYSIQVCEKLSEAYEDIMAQLGEQDIEMNDSKAITTANGCITAIYRIITSIGSQTKDNKKDVIIEIEEKVHQVLINSLDTRFQDVHESILTCIGALCYHIPVITSNLWGLFPKILELINYNIQRSCEYGLVSPGVMAIMNYMQKDPEIFTGTEMQNGETPFAAVVGLISNSISQTHESDVYLNTNHYLIIGLLENLHGKIDSSIGSIIELLVGEIDKNEERSARILIVQALSM